MNIKTIDDLIDNLLIPARNRYGGNTKITDGQGYPIDQIALEVGHKRGEKYITEESYDLIKNELEDKKINRVILTSAEINSIRKAKKDKKDK